MEFVELYRGQKRFQDICDLLHGMGLTFVRFITLGEQGQYKAPLGFRHLGPQTWAEALFLRRPDAASGQCELTRKLCFMAVAFGIVEWAGDCFRELRAICPLGPLFNPASSEYERFLHELFVAYEQGTKLWPPTFARILPPDMVRPFASAMLDDWPSLLRGLLEFDDQYLRQLDDLQREEDTEFESVLRRLDLAEHADRINFKRRDQAYKIARAIRSARLTG